MTARVGAAVAATAAVTSLLHVGCSLGDAADPARPRVVVPSPRDFASGARLRARIWRIGGSVDVLRAFHDTALDVDCAFLDDAGAHAAPGASYVCVPSPAATHRDGVGPFADRDCTEPVGAVAPGDAPSFVVVEPRDACAAPPVVHRAGPIVASRVPYERDASGACVRGAAPIAWAPLGERLADDALVRAVEAPEDRGGRIAARVLVASDGARQVVGGLDARGRSVAPAVATDGATRWLPSRVAFVGAGDVRFEDASCTHPVATKLAHDAICPLDAALAFEGACGVGALYALGVPVDPAATFQLGDRGCAPARGASAVRAFELGAPLAAASFEAAEPEELGVGAARRRAFAATNGRAVVLREPVDAATGQPCVVTTTADGALRCAPAVRASVAFFADDACTEPAFVDPISPCDPSAEAPAAVRGGDDPPAIFVVTREIARVFARRGSGCAPFDPPVASRAFAVAEGDPASLPLVEELAE